MSSLEVLLWIVIPYLCMAIFVLGHVWRYRQDKFGWTTRSSQMYESRLLRLGSPLFHFGVLAVLGGHVVGILVPASVTHALGMSEEVYHLQALVFGGLAGLATVTGLGILLYRRSTVPGVARATTRNDKVMYAVLGTVLLLGLAATFSNAGGGHEYRETIAPWFRSLLYLQPQPGLIGEAPLLFQLHAMSAWLLVAFWPFTRLVHVLSAPLGYLTRPYIVYRSRAPQHGLRGTRRGWDAV